MKPETANFLAKAKRKLQSAQRMIALDFPEDAARTAYLACFHLAQAVIFEKSGRIAKTHKGVHAAFYQEIGGNAAVGGDLPGFLGKSYRYKYAADYATRLEDETTFDTAAQAVETASRFFAHFAKLLD